MSSSSSTGETKSESGSAPTSSKLNIKFQAQDGGTEIIITVAPNMPFSKIIDGYCNKKGMKPDSVRFLFEGQRINPSDTPKSLGMENEDAVDVMLHQVGG